MFKAPACRYSSFRGGSHFAHLIAACKFQISTGGAIARHRVYNHEVQSLISGNQPEYWLLLYCFLLEILTFFSKRLIMAERLVSAHYSWCSPQSWYIIKDMVITSHQLRFHQWSPSERFLYLGSLWKAAVTLIVEQGADKLGIIDFVKDIWSKFASLSQEVRVLGIHIFATHLTLDS